MILVAGATGLVGGEVCQRLVKRGKRVRGLVRTTSAPEKVERLRTLGVELAIGDLKDPASLNSACAGVEAIVSTASSTFSRAEGDSIESVDGAGQLALVAAAQSAGIDRFVFVSFRHPAGMTFPLNEAKLHVERAIAGMNHTILQASFFMEAWLAPATGFDYPNATARIYGDGDKPISWVSFQDVAEMCVVSLENAAAWRRTIAIGGPAALSPLEAVARFEAIGGRRFKLEHVPLAALQAQFSQASNSMEQSFAALMLGFAFGDGIDMASTQKEFGLRLLSVDEYASSVLRGA